MDGSDNFGKFVSKKSKSIIKKYKRITYIIKIID
jgi:hypothetical protein